MVSVERLLIRISGSAGRGADVVCCLQAEDPGRVIVSIQRWRSHKHGKDAGFRRHEVDGVDPLAERLRPVPLLPDVGTVMHQQAHVRQAGPGRLRARVDQPESYIRRTENTSTWKKES